MYYTQRTARNEKGRRVRSPTADNPQAWSAMRISMRWDRARRRVDAGQQLKVAEGRLLWLLEDEQPRTLREIAEALQLEQSTVNRQVNAALAAGLLTRSRSEDGSAYRVKASATGREKFRTDVDRHMALQASALGDIPDDERETFLRHLAAYVDALNAAVGPDPA